MSRLQDESSRRPCINIKAWLHPNQTFFMGSTGYADIENRLMDKSRREEGEGETNGESNMEAYTLTYVK